MAEGSATEWATERKEDSNVTTIGYKSSTNHGQVASPIEEFLRDMEDYYGKYRSGVQRDVTYQYLLKRFNPGDLQKLKKYLFENHHANYGAPIVSTIKKQGLDVAFKEDGVMFTRPKRKAEGNPMAECKSCNKVSPMTNIKCAYCGEFLSGNSSIRVPRGYFID